MGRLTRRARALGPRRRRGSHAGRGRAERVVARPRAGARSTRARTGSAGPGRTRPGSTRSLGPRRGRPGSGGTLVGTARRSTGTLSCGAARRAGTRRRRPALTALGPWAGRGLPWAGRRAAEVGRGDRRPRRPGHPRGAGSARCPLSPGVGSGQAGVSGVRPGPGRGRLGNRRQRAGRHLGRRGTCGPVRGGAFGRGRALRRAVGRLVRRGPGHGRGARSRPGRRSGRVVVTGLRSPR